MQGHAGHKVTNATKQHTNTTSYRIPLISRLRYGSDLFSLRFSEVLVVSFRHPRKRLSACVARQSGIGIDNSGIVFTETPDFNDVFE